MRRHRSVTSWRYIYIWIYLGSLCALSGFLCCYFWERERKKKWIFRNSSLMRSYWPVAMRACDWSENHAWNMIAPNLPQKHPPPERLKIKQKYAKKNGEIRDKSHSGWSFLVFGLVMIAAIWLVDESDDGESVVANWCSNNRCGQQFSGELPWFMRLYIKSWGWNVCRLQRTGTWANSRLVSYQS